MNVEFRNALTRKRAELVDNGGMKPLLRASMQETTRQGDRIDQTAGINEVHIQLKLKQTDAKILQAIDDAFWRIERGFYGTCEECAEEISKARLRAIPWARKCITCKEKEKESAPVAGAPRPPMEFRKNRSRAQREAMAYGHR